MQNRRGRSQCSQDHPEILELRRYIIQESGLNVGTVHDSAGFLLDERTNDGKADLFFFFPRIFISIDVMFDPLSLSLLDTYVFGRRDRKGQRDKESKLLNAS